MRSAVKRRPQPHDVRIFLLSLLAGLPAVLATLGLLVAGDYSAKITWTLGTVVVLVWLVVSAAVRERVLRPLQTASNLVAALREDDFSVRGRGARLGDPLGELMLELNELSATLREQRLGSLEAGALLQRGPVCGPGTQGMAPYDGAPTSVTVENFSAAGALMRFDVLIAPTPAAD